MRLLFFLFVLFFAIDAQGKTVEVCLKCPIGSLQKALDIAERGDEIRVLEGVYTESDLIIDKPLLLKGIGLPVIDGRNSGHILIVQADSVTIVGFRLVNVGQSYTEEYAAVYINRADHFVVKDMVLENVFFGILVEKSHYGSLTNNRISGEAKNEAAAGNGIHLWHCSHVQINGNNISGVRDGIYFEFVSESTIERNVSYDNIRYGLHFMFSNNDAYRKNLFTRNGAGVAVMFSKFIVMTENHFYKNWGTASYGLLLKEINDAEIEGNRFEENTIGINLEGSNRINYTHNDFIRNGWAVKIAGACYTNLFQRNNFLSNSLDISYNSKLNDNLFEGNYWSTYTGYDLNRDGVGDVPFRPVKLFSYVVNRTPETIVLLRSLFVDLINFSEKVSPVFTPDDLMDSKPLIKKIP